MAFFAKIGWGKYDVLCHPCSRELILRIVSEKCSTAAALTRGFSSDSVFLSFFSGDAVANNVQPIKLAQAEIGFWDACPGAAPRVGHVILDPLRNRPQTVTSQETPATT